MIIIGTILAYFCILLLISRVTGGKADNEAFFRANGKSPWYLVAFGMIGASISGVTFVSVPGMVMVNNMSYMQTCLGFILGYFAVAYLLLPVYYRLHLTTIYSYLQTRLGNRSYKTGASFFLLSKMAGAAVRFCFGCLWCSFCHDCCCVSITYLVVHTTRRDTNTRFNRYFPNRLYVSGTSPYYI